MGTTMEELPSLENETRQRSPSLPLVTLLKQSPVGSDPMVCRRCLRAPATTS